MALPTEHIPPELTAEPRWVRWRYEQRDGQRTKVPLNARTGERAKSNDPKTWVDFETVMRSSYGDGIGFELGDGFAGVDLDGCFGPDGLAPWAEHIVNLFHSYTESSPSGTGVHILMRGSLPDGERGKNIKPIEVYDNGRFFTITGRVLPGLPMHLAEDESAALAVLIDLLRERRDFAAWAKTRKASEKVGRLMLGERTDYPSSSEADLALLGYLARWTDGDEEKAKRIAQLSPLWDAKFEREDYWARTWAKVNDDLPGRVTIDSSEFTLTELGNARRLIVRHGRDLLHCLALKQWYFWDGRRWAKDATGEVLRLAKETVKSIYVEAQACPDHERRKLLAQHAVRSESDRAIEAMLSLAETEAEVAVEPVRRDADPWLLTVLNGTLDLRTGDLRPHHREDLITKMVPVEYDPEARSELWERVLTWALPDPEVRGFFQRAVGYSLTGDTREEKFLLVHGPAATSKSTVIESVRHSLGDYAATADFETFLKRRDVGGPRNDIARLAGSRMVVSIEVEQGRRLADGLVKLLVGGDKIAARFLYSEAFEFQPAFKLWLVANHAPKVSDEDSALWRRLLRVPFENIVPEGLRDLTLKAKLREPGAQAAILAWAIEGCLLWQQTGLGVPEAVKEATAAYRTDMDPLRGFWEGFVFAPDAWIAAAELRSQYERWARENGETRLLRGEEFGTRLRARGCEPANRGTEGRGWRGIAWPREERAEL